MPSQFSYFREEYSGNVRKTFGLVHPMNRRTERGLSRQTWKLADNLRFGHTLKPSSLRLNPHNRDIDEGPLDRRDQSQILWEQNCDLASELARKKSQLAGFAAFCLYMQRDLLSSRNSSRELSRRSESQIQDLQEKLESVDQAFKDLSLNCSSLQSKLSMKEKELAALEASLRNKDTAYRINLERSESQIKALEDKLDWTETELEASCHESQAFQLNYYDLEAKLKRVQWELDMYQASNLQLQNYISTNNIGLCDRCIGLDVDRIRIDESDLIDLP